MALTSTVADGFRDYKKITPDSIYWLPGTAGTTYAKGDAVSIAVGTGTLALTTTDDAIIGFAAQDVVCPANTVGFPRPAGHIVNRGSDATPMFSTLVPVKLNITGEVQAKLCKFANQDDDTVAAYSSSTPSLTLTSALGGNDYGNGGLVYVYEGTGAGQANIAKDYVDSTKVLTLVRKFDVDLSTDSKVIILGAAAANVGIAPWSRIEVADEDGLDVTNGTDNGNHVAIVDWREIPETVGKLQLPVVPAAACVL